VLSDSDGFGIQALAARIAALETAVAAFTDGARVHLADLRLALDPASVTAAVASRSGLRDRLAPSVQAWAEYTTRYAGSRPGEGSVLSDKALARAIGARLGRQDPEESSL
jgi:hypothetical protein